MTDEQFKALMDEMREIRRNTMIVAAAVVVSAVATIAAIFS